MSIHTTEAIVLRKIDFRETSLITTFYTREFGRLTGILKGIRSDPRKFASTIELFSVNEIIFYRKRNSGIHLVSQCDVKNNFDPVRRDIAKIGAASLMMELLYAIMPEEDRNDEIFNLTLESLNELASNANADKIARIFKIKVLSLSGFRPHFDSCISCGTKINGQSKFSLSMGGLLCLKCCRKDLSSRMIFRGTVSSILYMQKNDFRSNLNLGMNYQIQKELDSILNSFLNFHLEKELKSQKVLNRMAHSNAEALI